MLKKVQFSEILNISMMKLFKDCAALRVVNTAERESAQEGTLTVVRKHFSTCNVITNNVFPYFFFFTPSDF